LNYHSALTGILKNSIRTDCAIIVKAWNMVTAPVCTGIWVHCWGTVAG